MRDIQTICKWELQHSFSIKNIIISIALLLIIISVTLSAGFIQFFNFMYVGNIFAIPITLLLPFYVLVLIIPFLTLMLTHGYIAKEIQQRTILFFLPAINRASYVIGKICASFFIHLTIIGILIIIIWGYTMYQLHTIYLSEVLLLLAILIGYIAGYIGIFTLLAIMYGNSQKVVSKGMFCIAVFHILLFFPTLKIFSPVWYAINGPFEPLKAILFFLALALATIGGALVIFERKTI